MALLTLIVCFELASVKKEHLIKNTVVFMLLNTYTSSLKILECWELLYLSVQAGCTLF
jgi:hypothetical protein